MSADTLRLKIGLAEMLKDGVILDGHQCEQVVIAILYRGYASVEVRTVRR